MAIYSGFSHEKWWFSIAMLNYQRVNFEVSQPRQVVGVEYQAGGAAKDSKRIFPPDRSFSALHT